LHPPKHCIPEPRTAVVRLRMTPTDVARVRSRANEDRRTVSEYLRLLILDALADREEAERA
jgi:hypothetical protein